MKQQVTISQETFERIEAYLLHQLPETQMAEVEHTIETDPQFASQVSEVSVLLEGIETASLSHTLHDFHNDIEEMPSKRNNAFLKYAVAASIILAIALIWLLSKPTPKEQLYAKFYAPDPGLPTVMSTTSEYEFYDGMVNYKQGNYGEALAKWQTLLVEKPVSDTLHYFIGMAHMANANINEALPYLNEALSTPTSVFYAEAVFYKALLLVKSDRLGEAQELLEANPTERNKALYQAINRLKDE